MEEELRDEIEDGGRNEYFYDDDTDSNPQPKFEMNKWNSKIEDAINLIRKQCLLYKKMHTEVSLNNTNKYSFFMISAIVTTPLSGVVTAIGTIICRELIDLQIYAITSTVLSFISGILITIIKFNKYDEISYSHKTAAARYISLEENIKRQLLLYKEDRINAHEYLNWISKSFDDLYISSPDFDSCILQKYSRQIDKLENDDAISRIRKQEASPDESILYMLDLNKYDDATMEFEMR